MKSFVRSTTACPRVGLEPWGPAGQPAPEPEENWTEPLTSLATDWRCRPTQVPSHPVLGDEKEKRAKQRETSTEWLDDTSERESETMEIQRQMCGQDQSKRKKRKISLKAVQPQEVSDSQMRLSHLYVFFFKCFFISFITHWSVEQRAYSEQSTWELSEPL